MICIFQERKMAAACTTDFSAVRHGVTLVVGEGPRSPKTGFSKHFLALGIAPDGVKAVRLRPIGAPAATVPVVANAYALEAVAPINIEKLIR